MDTRALPLSLHVSFPHLSNGQFRLPRAVWGLIELAHRRSFAECRLHSKHNAGRLLLVLSERTSVADGGRGLFQNPQAGLAKAGSLSEGSEGS